MSSETSPKTKPDAQPLKVVLSVYRRLDNRIEGLPDNSPRAVELHQRRKEALHEALSGVAGWRIDDWGSTDDERPHELVDVALTIASNPHVQTALLFGATWALLELAKASIGAFAGEAVKALLSRLIPKQKEQKILDFSITLPDGTVIRVDPESQVSVSSNRAS
ncbi:MAG TPA: hypothetical protein VG675_07770 [Bryobacteraceae bacterium]|nr:hypothetical protein [Bryobacteraceae bacterium]